MAFRYSILASLLALQTLFVSTELDGQDQRLDVAGQKEETQKTEIRITGTVVSRHKYHMVVNDGKTNHRIAIANVQNVVLHLNRPLLDLQNKQLSVMPTDGKKRRSIPIAGSKVFLARKFAHSKQLDRFLSSDDKRMTNYWLNHQPLSNSGKLVMGGEILPSDSKRSYRLKTSKTEYEIVLGAGGKITNQSVTSIKAGDKITAEGVIDGNRLLATKIEWIAVVE